jgi:endonuclease YncB( thermonuclease family)
MSMNRFISVLLVVVVAACSPVGGERYTRKQAQKSLRKLETPGITVGEFKVSKIVDGDTIRVDGLDNSLRLLAMDTEETFKSELNRRAVETDWVGYLAEKRGKTRPGRIETPMGEIAKAWAKEFFAGVTTVRIERDHPGEIRDRFNRYLAYVLAPKDGKWVNFNVEAVRAGMSPYYTKYGYSRRYHSEFLAAQDEARNAKRGIWSPDPKLMKYPDYKERFEWFEARATFMEAFRNEGKDNPSYVDLTHWDALKRLEEHVGKEVKIIGVVAEVRYAERGPSRVLLSYRMFNDFPLVFFDRDILVQSGLPEWKGEFIVVTGTVTDYTNKKSGKKQLQIAVDRASQIRLSKVPGLPDPATPTTPTTTGL